MNEYERRNREVQRLKELYPEGTRLELIGMDDPFSPVDPGTRGTVRHVDDMGTIHMNWDNGRTLGIIPGEDSFRKLTDEEILAEKQEQAELESEHEDEKLDDNEEGFNEDFDDSDDEHVFEQSM